MQITLIRHSKTPGNAEYRYNGRTDEPLSAEGIALAQQAGADPNVSTVYVTPLQRTRQTAAILFPTAKQIIVDDLREMDFGDFEGFNFADLEHNGAYRAWVDGGCIAPCPNGEGRAEFCRRVCAAFEGILRRAAEEGEESLTFVVHGGTIMAIMERYARPTGEFYSFRVKNAQGYRCRVEMNDQLSLVDAAPWEKIKSSLAADTRH